MAERERFELSSPAKGCQFSRLVYSTALPSLRGQFYWKPIFRATAFLALAGALVGGITSGISILERLLRSCIFVGL